MRVRRDPRGRSRRAALILLIGPAVLVAGLTGRARLDGANLGFSFKEVAAAAGLTAVTVFGGKDANRYLLETTGTGVALFDLRRRRVARRLPRERHDPGGLSQGPGADQPSLPESRRRHVRGRDRARGPRRERLGPGRCAGDYDNDGHEDLYVTYYGQNRLYRNRGDGTFEDVTARAGLLDKRTRWGTGCAFLDYDRDGKLDLLAANYIDLDLATAPTPDSGLCRYKGVKVACGPPGLTGGKNVLFHNRGDGTFEDVSDKSGITKASGTYGLGVSTLDFDDDGWVDAYVANDSNPSALYRNNHDGTFTDIAVTSGCAYSQDGKPQAGMGVAIGDYDHNGTMDIFKTNFAGDTSTLYANSGQGFCDDRTFAAGIGVNTRWLGWATAFVDLGNDGWLDLFLANGHVYPEVAQLKTEAAYAQRKVVYLNRGNGRFEDVTEQLGAPATTPRAARGAAFGDIDNDGDVDIVISNVNASPDLFRTETQAGRHWLLVKLTGTTSNRSAIGARVGCTAGGMTRWQEVRGGGSYISQNDLRAHFGLGETSKVDRLWVRWPNGLEEEWRDVAADQILALREGAGRKAPR